ncbi:hypothetical protein IMZ48_40690 [Candidatus Bathyarchaeota archaeon]|nr:hypothetical protein [Candidatus Bathyarchaeota archaeon]
MPQLQVHPTCPDVPETNCEVQPRRTFNMHGVRLLYISDDMHHAAPSSVPACTLPASGESHARLPLASRLPQCLAPSWVHALKHPPISNYAAHFDDGSVSDAFTFLENR